MARTKVLDDAEWAEEREALTQRYFGVDAATFAATIDTAGYDPVDLEEVLAYFPELD